MRTIRQRIWLWLCRNRKEGERLTRGLLLARVVLFPLDCFYWHMERNRGYDIETDTWVINGLRYGGMGLMRLSLAGQGGAFFRIRRRGEYLEVTHYTSLQKLTDAVRLMDRENQDQ